MMLVTCATRAALGAVGVIAEDRPVRWHISRLYCPYCLCARLPVSGRVTLCSLCGEVYAAAAWADHKKECTSK